MDIEDVPWSVVTWLLSMGAVVVIAVVISRKYAGLRGRVDVGSQVARIGEGLVQMHVSELSMRPSRAMRHDRASSLRSASIERLDRKCLTVSAVAAFVVEAGGPRVATGGNSFSGSFVLGGIDSQGCVAEWEDPPAQRRGADRLRVWPTALPEQRDGIVESAGAGSVVPGLDDEDNDEDEDFGRRRSSLPRSGLFQRASPTPHKLMPLTFVEARQPLQRDSSLPTMTTECIDVPGQRSMAGQGSPKARSERSGSGSGTTKQQARGASTAKVLQEELRDMLVAAAKGSSRNIRYDALISDSLTEFLELGGWICDNFTLSRQKVCTHIGADPRSWFVNATRRMGRENVVANIKNFCASRIVDPLRCIEVFGIGVVQEESGDFTVLVAWGPQGIGPARPPGL